MWSAPEIWVPPEHQASLEAPLRPQTQVYLPLASLCVVFSLRSPPSQTHHSIHPLNRIPRSPLYRHHPRHEPLAEEVEGRGRSPDYQGVKRETEEVPWPANQAIAVAAEKSSQPLRERDGVEDVPSQTRSVEGATEHISRFNFSR